MSHCGCFVVVDKWFINCPLSILIDMRPSASIKWTHADPKGAFSDHLPVVISAGQPQGDIQKQLPRWVYKTPQFKDRCSKIQEDYHFPSRCAPEEMLSVKELICEAAKHVMHQPPAANTLEQKIFWTLLLLRRSYGSHVCNVQRSFYEFLS